MGIFDKLKNALFEEEYVEVEEKPKAKLKKEKNRFKKASKPDTSSQVEEKPIAKKIILPEKTEVYSDNDDVNDYEEEVLEESVEEKKDNSFKIMDDNDFKSDDYAYEDVEPKIVKVIEKDNNTDNYSNYYNGSNSSSNLYQGSKKEEKKKMPYGLDETPKVNVHQYGAYERKDERGYFKPSPIISPIYGILDKNYKKEEIVTRKDVRLSSSYSREKLNVDEVRNKAYGKLEDEIEEVSFDETPDNKPTFEIEKDNLLVDLTSDDKKPSVKEVTMGDALEYFQDLGLEYNVDYVDATKKATGRRVKDNYEELKQEKTDNVDSSSEKKPNNVDSSSEKKLNNVDDLSKKEKEEKDTKEEIKKSDDDDNLFDLIDSMYKEEE